MSGVCSLDSPPTFTCSAAEERPALTCTHARGESSAPQVFLGVFLSARGAVSSSAGARAKANADFSLTELCNGEVRLINTNYVVP